MDTELRARLRDLANERRRFGYQTPAAHAERLTTATDRHAAQCEGYAQGSVTPSAQNGVSTKRAPLPAG
jgi:hypothetical protein